MVVPFGLCGTPGTDVPLAIQYHMTIILPLATVSSNILISQTVAVDFSSAAIAQTEAGKRNSCVTSYQVQQSCVDQD